MTSLPLALTPRIGKWFLTWWRTLRMLQRTSCRGNMSPWLNRRWTFSLHCNQWRRRWPTSSWVQLPLALRSTQRLLVGLLLRRLPPSVPPPCPRVRRRCRGLQVWMCRWNRKRRKTQPSQALMPGQHLDVPPRFRHLRFKMYLSRWSLSPVMSNNWWTGWTRRRSLTFLRNSVTCPSFQQWVSPGSSWHMRLSRHRSNMTRSCGNPMLVEGLGLVLEVKIFATAPWALQGQLINARNASQIGLSIGISRRLRCAFAIRRWSLSRRQHTSPQWSPRSIVGSFLSLGMASRGSEMVRRYRKLRLPVAVTCRRDRWCRTFRSKRSMQWTSEAWLRLHFVRQITLRRHSQTTSQAMVVFSSGLRFFTEWWMQRPSRRQASPDLRFLRISSMGRRHWCFIQMRQRPWRWQRNWRLLTSPRRKPSTTSALKRRWMRWSLPMPISSTTCRVGRSR